MIKPDGSKRHRLTTHRRTPTHIETHRYRHMQTCAHGEERKRRDYEHNNTSQTLVEAQ